ncbi:ATP-grasp domain-containing protein [Bacillus sp. C28GYM-DRY-1]|uniref:ATP-grasp domain-containing protein n=1 Tax=Bacillus sp. C28GYM-DRY-1 TaxID=3062686 RepID=UPI0026766FD1|nr:ATP-grasp domain-containing protein [Bacillus sp. C28GYM-DRY-1]MDO3659686.1 ATP-grasp domain-containing protein [Bacillus sp. C28GYM-DRY-1]
MRTALLISPRASVIEDARKAGYNYIFVFIKETLQADIERLADEVFLFNWNDYRKALYYAKIINKMCPLHRIYGFGEYSVKLAAYLTEALGIKGVTLGSVERATNKSLMRRLLNQEEKHRVLFETVSSYQELKEAVEKISFPVIVKPIDGAGSSKVFKLSNLQDLNMMSKQFDLDTSFICEEYIEGKEISIEAISFNGSHKIIAITEKQTTGNPRFIESGHILPFHSDKALYQQIEESVHLTLDILTLKTGISHTEMIITLEGPKIVETHVRPGGDKITDLVRLATGTSLFFALFYYDLNEVSVYPDTIEYECTASSQFLFFQPGKVQSILGENQLKEHPNVIEYKLNVKQGDVLQTPEDSGSRHGSIIIKGRNKSEVEDLISEIKSLLRIEYK